MLTKRELQDDNEELICLLHDILCCCEEQGCVLPVDIMERVDEFLIIDDDGAEIIDVKPLNKPSN